MTIERWQKLTDIPLVVAALVFLVAYSFQVIGHLHGDALHATQAIIWITWGAFALDYVIEFWLAKPRWRWFYTHLFDLVIVVLPMLRPLRLLRLVVVLKFFHRSAGAAFRGRVVLYAAGGAALLVYVAALAVLEAERGHHGTIQNFGEALWWAFVTITTVGYGDFVPVTAEGRIIGVFVMVGGISLLGIVTATIASWIVDQVAKAGRGAELVTKAHVDEVLAEIKALRADLQQHSAGELANSPRRDSE